MPERKQVSFAETKQVAEIDALDDDEMRQVWYSIEEIISFKLDAAKTVVRIQRLAESGRWDNIGMSMHRFIDNVQRFFVLKTSIPNNSYS
jgi:hypothetical protein